MEIKVGSEWVNENGLNFTVLFIDDGKCFVRWEDGKHTVISSRLIKGLCKPAPVRRTVWLNVYASGVNKYENKDRADYHKHEGILWQQEVELIDPRENGK